MSVAVVDRLRGIANGYDLFLVDQWGVLHDGMDPYPGAIEALAGLKSLGKAVVLLSNSSKRRDVTIERMMGMGFTRDHFDDCVTSGEEVWRALKERTDPFYAALGRRCFMLTWDGDRHLLEGLDLEEVDDLADADFVLNAGTSSQMRDVSENDPLLRQAADRGLPMVCANPDFVSVRRDGTQAICPGTIAQRYEALGGAVDYRGKPHAPVYRRCRELAPGAERALAIGDSLYHDIGGAQDAGMESVFVAGGIHAAEAGVADGAALDEAALEALFRVQGRQPTYVMRALQW